ncbi:MULTISPECIES: NAD(P)/FAD-dependent oxidoreductase [unclassified Tolypothrix]|uniref:NAD(P)/FAD-dependent oxidoreductase n=1 Tax=unclassified Tolypothrix TaxID=2649714 RepID=UPI0005F7FFDA|nr:MULTISPECIES: NAD(P)/FAD-dependent oxidoreductase [unclassified Tolypothrix]MBE9083201.1 NAD(P)/FAD-dependent oxidoreductase [Tolypothrix sp. LEGE 11397]UYD23988.1 NAD(P)/FAD-dependent oxidoreductase [Tolypothrix sp. PCC 7712]UYD33783.1 NAD(P)/FAD-dependent oxidoreductase [Tolypothrix sp. PCC 7601]BAY89727.1 putative NADH dehydrogenase [Microchaete diplosiphon NIES-3275]
MQQASQATVILGGGFAGLFTALHLSQRKYTHQVILIEQRDRFSFKPLLYELLSGELHSAQVYPRYKELLASSSVTFVQDTVKSIDLEQSRVTLTSSRIFNYRNLVLALGSKTTYFNTPGAAEYAMPFTSGEQAIALRKHLRHRLHQAIQTSDPARRRLLLTVAIIGAGPAGIELACTLADLLPIWYDELGGDAAEIRVVLINRSKEILKGDVNSHLRCTAQRALKGRIIPVDFLFDAAVSKIQADSVEYQQNNKTQILQVGTIAWTAGTTANPLLMNLPVANNRGRLLVTPTLQLPDFPEVFAAGDCAADSDQPQPPTAQVAYQQGIAIAQNIQHQREGKSPIPVEIKMRGTLMKLGLNEGVANLFNKVQIPGQPGHLIREATYLQLLPNAAHNRKITTEWLTDELFQRHRPASYMQLGQTPWLSGVATLAAGVIFATPLVWRAAQPMQFQQNLHWTGVPTLLNQLAPPPQ